MAISSKQLLTGLLAVLAMSALVAPVARAEKELAGGVFTPEVGANDLAEVIGQPIGAGPHEFKIGAMPSITCPTSAFAGSALTKGKSTQQMTLLGVWTSCHATVLGTKRNVDIATGFCGFLLTATTTETKGVKGFTAHADITCGAGEKVLITIWKDAKNTEVLCKYEVKAQTGLTEITLTNNQAAKPDDIEGLINLQKIATTRIEGSALDCGALSNTATYTGEITLKGRDPNTKNQVNLTISG